MNIRLILLLGAVLCARDCHATILAKGNSALNTETFSTAITAKAYDIATGTLFLGLSTAVDGATQTSLSGEYAISKLNRPYSSFAPVATPIATLPVAGGTPGVSPNGWYIEFLYMATSRGNTNPNLAVVLMNGTGTFGTPPNPLTQNFVSVMKPDGTIFTSSATLLDSSGSTSPVPSTTGGVIGIAANRHYIFPLLRTGDPFSTTKNWGESGSGVGLVEIKTNTLASSTSALSLEVKDAPTGAAGNRAVQLDLNSSELTGGFNQVAFPPGVSNQNLNQAEIQWDEILQRLYIGVRIETTDTGGQPFSVGKSVVVGRVDSTFGNGLILEEIVTNSAIDTTRDEVVIFGTPTPATPGQDLSAKNLRVMHTTTGASYLIVNGGLGATDTVGNLVYALPLVDVGNPSDATQGTLANKNAFNTTRHRFEVAATAPGDLANTDDQFIHVGVTPLPIEEALDISDMQVIGDAVYISLSNSPNSLNDSGLFYSEAMFDEEGKIIRWTPWTKKAFPVNGFPDSTQPGITYFAVDALTSKVWAVDADTQKTIRITAWDQGKLNSLPYMLNKSFPHGVFSALDLDQSTRGFIDSTENPLDSTLSRYALFGGTNGVAIARVSIANVVELNSPQQTMLDYNLPANYRVTSLPLNAGSVTTLEYSRKAATDPDFENYFFAGTDRGLYVFTQPGDTGFVITDAVGPVDIPPFNTGFWQQAPNIVGSIVDIKTTGNTLYVVTYQTTAANPMLSRVYRIDYQPTVAAMFAPANIYLLAESNVTEFAGVSFFEGIQIISTAVDGSAEQLILATNRGLFRSSSIGGVQAATDQSSSVWLNIDPNDLAWYNGIAGIDNASTEIIDSIATTSSIDAPSTVWPFSLRDEKECRTFLKSKIDQLSGTDGTTNRGIFNFVPRYFNSIDALINKNFELLNKILYFWTDGGRRVFITTSNNITGQLLSLPYDTISWAISIPSQGFLIDPLVTQTNNFYWLKLIGVTGILLAGTGTGVIALE